MKQAFILDDNKSLLWNILSNNNMFNGIPNNKLEEVKSIFENAIKLVYNSSENSNDPNFLIELNKKFLSNIKNDLNNYKKSLLESSSVKSEFKDE